MQQGLYVYLNKIYKDIPHIINTSIQLRVKTFSTQKIREKEHIPQTNKIHEARHLT